MLDSLQDVELGGVFGEIISMIKDFYEKMLKFFSEKLNITF